MGSSAFAGNVYCVSVSLGLEIISVLNGFGFLKNNILAFWVVGIEDPAFVVTYPTPKWTPTVEEAELDKVANKLGGQDFSLWWNN